MVKTFLSLVAFLFSFSHAHAELTESELNDIRESCFNTAGWSFYDQLIGYKGDPEKEMRSNMSVYESPLVGPDHLDTNFFWHRKFAPGGNHWKDLWGAEIGNNRLAVKGRYEINNGSLKLEIHKNWEEKAYCSETYYGYKIKTRDQLIVEFDEIKIPFLKYETQEVTSWVKSEKSYDRVTRTIVNPKSLKILSNAGDGKLTVDEDDTGFLNFRSIDSDKIYFDVKGFKACLKARLKK